MRKLLTLVTIIVSIQAFPVTAYVPGTASYVYQSWTPSTLTMGYGKAFWDTCTTNCYERLMLCSDDGYSHGRNGELCEDTAVVVYTGEWSANHAASYCIGWCDARRNPKHNMGE